MILNPFQLLHNLVKLQFPMIEHKVNGLLISCSWSETGHRNNCITKRKFPRGASILKRKNMQCSSCILFSPSVQNIMLETLQQHIISAPYFLGCYYIIIFPLFIGVVLVLLLQLVAPQSAG